MTDTKPGRIWEGCPICKDCHGTPMGLVYECDEPECIGLHGITMEQWERGKRADEEYMAENPEHAADGPLPQYAKPPFPCPTCAAHFSAVDEAVREREEQLLTTLEYVVANNARAIVNMLAFSARIKDRDAMDYLVERFKLVAPKGEK